MLLQHRPPDRRLVFRQTELALAAAKKELSYAHHRLEQAHKRLDELGPLSQLRRHWRKERAATLERIDAFTDDIYKGEEKISHYQRVLKGLRPELDRRLQWDGARLARRSAPIGMPN